MSKKNVSAVILAGGQGSRMDGADKGWVAFEGQSLVERLLAQLTTQVDEIIVSANRNVERYRALDVAVIEDLRPGYAGPLAGIEAALSVCATDWLLTCSVDTLNVPPDYAQRMLAAGPSVVVQQARVQPVFMLVPRGALPALRDFLDAGERKVGLWAEQQALRHVSFDNAASSPVFVNLNDWQALQQAQQ